MGSFAGILLLASTATQATLLLGVHAEEPAPTIGRLIAQLSPNEERIELRSFPSSDDIIAAMQAGEVQLGIIEDSARALPDIALVADLYPSVLHVLYRGSAPPDNLGDMLVSGATWAGAPGSPGYRLAQKLVGDFGLSVDSAELLADPFTAEPDAYFIFGGILQTDALRRLPGFRLYSLDNPQQLMHGSVAEGIALRYPSLRPFVLPAQLYPSLSDQPALTLSITNLLVSRADLPTDTIYQLAMGIDSLRPQIAADYPLAGVQSLASREPAAQALPLHIGARRYRDRDLPGFLERYAEVLALGTTVMLASGTVLATIRRQRRQSRKDRLDTFYQRLLELRDQLTGSESDPLEVAEQVRLAQSEVMALVIEERIDADGSLMAFLTLSNRLLDETESRKADGA